MAEPTLTIFGENATQDANTITISKADLPNFTPAASNNPESIVAALTLLWATTLSQANQDSNADQQITVIPSTIPSIVIRNNNNYRQTTYNINFQKLDPTGGLDPSDY